MIESITLKNFKSVVDLTLELGTFNVLIGENGCGKSNILEGIAFGAAAGADKLDHEFLGSRGIRTTKPEFMFSAFEANNNEPIYIEFSEEDKSTFSFQLKLDPKNPRKWVDQNRRSIIESVSKLLPLLMAGESLKNSEFDGIEESEIPPELTALLTRFKDDKDAITIFGDGFRTYLDLYISGQFKKSDLFQFLLFCPENTVFRRYEESSQILPLGFRGEGLFQYLKELSQSENSVSSSLLTEIQQHLSLLDWFEGIELQDAMMSNEYFLKIKDRYLPAELRYFDQRSTNEGFLFLLFYLTLFISPDTPKFFAIDNIEASFNPRLCTRLIQTLVRLAKEHGKQVIVTTHNPAILDGLDLSDDAQRLFVVRRNMEGHTKAKRVPHKPERSLPMSEIWTAGMIGGLPDNF